MKNSLDVFMISETKLDETLPEGQFLMWGLSHHIGWIEIRVEVV